MVTPTLEDVMRMNEKEEYDVIPVRLEIMGDHTTPIEILRILKKRSRHTYLLESADHDKRWGRYSFLGLSPLLEITCLNGTLTVRADGEEKRIDRQPGAYIREVLNQYRSPKLPDMPPFTGGLTGYFAYDYIKYSEPKLRLGAEDQDSFQDVDLMLFNKVICYDHYSQKILLIGNVPTAGMESEYLRVVQELKELKACILQGEKEDIKPLRLLSKFDPLFDESTYCRMVEKAQKYILEGDIFQVVLSNRLEAAMEGSLLDVYRVLRTINPSPYMFYFSGTEGEIAGASPETLVKLENGIVHTFPLAGTRGRGADREEDERLERELLSDEKELAEHNMLVDLGRNDIGRISETGTVKIDRYMSVERFSHVMHIGSAVSGKVKAGKDALDVIDAILPAGTLSGAPKLRACEIINELENNKRGIYGGAIGYLAFNGNMDTCIAIRLAFSKNGRLFIRSGAGIVADSNPSGEYRECIQKAAAMVSAVKQAEEI